MILTDNGTNFVEANIEIKKAFNEINHTNLSNFLMELGERISYLLGDKIPMASNLIIYLIIWQLLGTMIDFIPLDE